MCFVWISEQTATWATYNKNWLVFITKMKSVYCAVWTGSLNKAGCAVLDEGLRPLACWDCGFESRQGHEYLSVVYCQVEVSTSDWSLAQGSPAECDFVWVWSGSLCNGEALVHWGLSCHGKNEILNILSDGRDKPKSLWLSQVKGYWVHFLIITDISNRHYVKSTLRPNRSRCNSVSLLNGWPGNRCLIPSRADKFLFSTVSKLAIQPAHFPIP
jgi:hypothetical protein